MSLNFNFDAAIPQSPGQIDRQDPPAATAETLAFVTANNEGRSQKPKKKGKDTSVKGLGSWVFDKKTRKRKYISLTGKTLHGPAAVQQSRIDKISALHPANSARSELRYLMATMAPNSLDDFFNTAAGDEVPHMGNTLSEQQQQSASTDTSLFGGCCNPCLLTSWGVPVRVVNRYEAAGVQKLFQWQIECLGSDGGMALRGGNLVYSAPTSGGKTLVSELLMLRRMGRVGGTIFFVVPFVALAEEKAEYFRTVWSDMFVGVRSFHGEDGGNTLTEDVDVAVCTIEKANILLNQLLDEKRESQLSMVVVDEVHMLSDTHRGFLLEVMLSKIKYLLASSVQIIAMSATLPNISDLAGWLGAALYTTEFRPVDLSVRVCMGRKIYRVVPLVGDSSRPNSSELSSGIMTGGAEEATAMDVDDTDGVASSVALANTAASTRKALFDPSAYDFKLESIVQGCSPGDDPDGVFSLCLEPLLWGKSVMLFCPSKQRCATCARELANIIREGRYLNMAAGVHRNSPLGGAESNSGAAAANNLGITGANLGISDDLRWKRMALLNELRLAPVRLCEVLKVTIPFGVAYHHAGLTAEERRIIENGFRSGTIAILCTTSTLAAGVNLPAHRVVIREPKMGPNDLTVSSFRQMCGRAGRLGYDTVGEAILMVKSYQQPSSSSSSTSASSFAAKNGNINSNSNSNISSGSNGSNSGRSGNSSRRGAAASGISNSEAVVLAKKLIVSEIDPLRSGLNTAYGGGLEKLILEMVCCGRLQWERDVMEFVQCTLMYVQQPTDQVVEWTRAAVRYLRLNQFLLHMSSSSSEGALAPSQLGRATVLSGLAPTDAVAILPHLERARMRLILGTGFHLVFLVTPPFTSSVIPDWTRYERVVDVLCREYPGVEETATYLGVSRADLVSFVMKPPAYSCNAPKTCFYRRFYAAMLLFLLTEEVPLNRVGTMLQSGKSGSGNNNSSDGNSGSGAGSHGQLQQLQKEASTFCGMTVAFCRKLNWHHLASCLETYTARLGFGVREELLPLVRMGAEMTSLRARAFVKSGIHNPLELTHAGLRTVTQILLDGMPFHDDAPETVGRKTGTASATTTAAAGVGAGVGASGTMVKIDERTRRIQACEVLAAKILKRAKEVLAEEISLLS